MQQKINNCIITIAAADCISPDWLVLHLTFPHTKSSTCDAASRQNSLTTCYILHGNYVYEFYNNNAEKRFTCFNVI